MLAEVVRSGFVESRHRGSVAALEDDGSLALSVGQVAEPMFPRSAVKPVQAVAMLRAGLQLDGELLALAAASHSGEPFHLHGVRRLLAGAGLDETALRTPPDWPLDEDSRLAVIRAGGEPRSVQMNCSGKHAAMLATCVAAGWSPDDYRAADHPLQQRIRATLEELSGESVAATGVDGCGAPLFAVSLTGLARAFSALVRSASGTPERRVADAVRAHPTWASGTTRDEAALMQGVPGLLAKAGAEAVYALALDDGRAVALKLEDGSQRARPAVVVAVLRKLGVEQPVLDEIAAIPVLGGGRPVGKIRAGLP